MLWLILNTVENTSICIFKDGKGRIFIDKKDFKWKQKEAIIS